MDSLLKILFIYTLFYTVGSQLLGLHEGETCKTENGRVWSCAKVEDCPQAGDPRKERPAICSFEGLRPVVCCPPNATAAAGRIATKYCVLYDLLSCKRGIYVKRDLYHPIVVGGRKAKLWEHPHMALLGYGPAENKEWLCGGTLISERYVLTAAHCELSHRLGKPKWIRLGDLDISSDTDNARPVDYGIERFIAHPRYTNQTVYHDIALVKLEEDVEFTSGIRPACLQINEEIADLTATATGWGRIDYVGPTSDQLMEVELPLVGGERCKRLLNKASLRMPQGIDASTMICAGEAEGGKDTCAGDSGGPLVISDFTKCLKRVIGVTSFGRQCALPNSPGIYTRVSYYLPWIEDVVWPDDPRY